MIWKNASLLKHLSTGGGTNGNESDAGSDISLRCRKKWKSEQDGTDNLSGSLLDSCNLL
jgi:hypothetical protein